MGDQVDFGVYQTIDFPTVYTSKNKLSKINRDMAGLYFEMQQQEAMVLARQLWIEAIYLNAREALIRERKKYAERVHDADRRKFEEGEVNQLEYNQSVLRLTQLINDLRRVEMKKEQNHTRMFYLAGEREVNVPDSILPASSDLVYEVLMKDYENLGKE